MTSSEDLSNGVGLAYLPNEILTSIFSHMMRSSIPVDLEDLIDKARGQPGHTSRGKPSCEHMKEFSHPRSCSCEHCYRPPLPWVDELDQDQKEHQMDWIMVNSISHQFRAAGKIPFFATKTFGIGWSMTSAMKDGYVRGLGTLNTKMAVSRISSVQALLRSKSICMLPTYTVFPRLKILKFETYEDLLPDVNEMGSNWCGDRFTKALKHLNCKIDKPAKPNNNIKWCTVEFTFDGQAVEMQQHIQEVANELFGCFC